MPRVRRIVMLFACLIVLASSVPGAAPRVLPAPAASLLEPPAAHAQISESGNFGNAVPCLESPDQFVTSCFANTIVSNSSISRVASSDTALVRFNTGGKTPLANLGQVGSIYGMAYDDGNVTGVRRLFLGAFARRMTGFGPSGPGAIYEYNLTTGALHTFTTVPGTTNRHTAGDADDSDVASWVTKSSLGDMEMGPSGYALYVMNLDTRQVDRYDTRTGVQLSSLPINFAALNADSAAQADMRPFALEFQPTNGTFSPQLLVGIVDSGERSPNNVTPTAYVVMINPSTGAQTTILTQSLGAGEIAGRFGDGVNAGHAAWHAWTPMGKGALWPMPILSDIQFSRDGLTMLLAFRDRNGDVYQPNNGDNWWRVQEQGDILTYKAVNGAWQLQTRSGVNTPSDYFRDDYVGNTSSQAHVENSMGALAWTLSGGSGSYTEQIVGTAITPLTGGTSGANWYNLQPNVPDRQAAVELVPAGDLWKSATLGDLENLCTYAFVGNVVWRDANANGVQDSGEPGVSGVLLNLIDPDNGAVVAQATTASDGSYLFAVQPNKDYIIEVAPINFNAGRPLFDFVLSPQDRGGDDTRDSDADQLSRRISVPPQLRDANNMTFDIGVIQESQANGIVGDRVWSDNGNGVQDAGEAGIPGITVRLINTATGAVEKTTTTDANGGYLFINVIPGTYVVEFVPPSGINAAPRDAGGNDALDSDADAGSGWRPPAFNVIADTVNTTLDLGLIRGANVRITKTGPAQALPGQAVSYSLVYANDGPAAADNVTVVDTLPSGVSYVSASPPPSSMSGQTITWNLGTLANGASGTITVNATVAAGANGQVTNQAQITTTTNNDTPGDNTSTSTTNVIRPNVTIQKSGPATVTVGNALAYTLSYANNGSASAAGVTIVDTLPNGVSFVSANPAPTSVVGQTITWNLGMLASGASGSITVNVQSSNTLANGTQLTNQVQITTTTAGDTPGDNSSSVTTTAQRADVAVTKSSPNTFPVASGQQVTYYLDFSNLGPAAAANVVLADTVPSQITGISWSCTSGCSGSGTGNSISINLGTLAAGATGRVTVTGTAQTSVAREDFTNTATITTSTPETNTTNNQSSVPGAVWTTDLQIVKLAQPQVAAGATFTATLSYKNNGPAPANGAQLTDTLPAGVSFVSSNPAPSSVSGQTLTWSVGTLADQAEGTIDLVLRADPTLANNTTVTNQSQIGTTTSDRTSSNNTSSAQTLVVTRSDVSVTKTGPARVSAGDTVNFTITYANNGPSVARAVIIEDTLPSELDFVSANPAPASNTAGVLTWNIGDLNPGASGSITVQMQSRFDQAQDTLNATNQARISTPTTDETPNNNMSSHTVAVETVDLSVTKTMPSFVVAGVPFTATLTYANAGPATAMGVTLRDLLPQGLTYLSASPAPSGPGLRWNLGSLPADGTGTITVRLQAPTTAISGTQYLNQAIVDTLSRDRDPSNDISQATTIVRPNADLTLVKTGTPGPILSGGTVTYTLAYRNAGPSQATEVRIVDTPPAGFTFTSSNPAPASTAGGVLTWQLGSLDAGDTGSIEVVGTLTGEGASIDRVNTARISSPATPDPVPGNNTSTSTTRVLQPDLSIVKTDGQTQAQPGDELTYTLTIRNSGPITATNITITETPPVPMSDPAWTVGSNGSYTQVIGELGPSASVTRTVTIRLPNPLPEALRTRIANVAAVRVPCCTDPTPGDNTSTDEDQPLAGHVGDFIWLDTDGDGQQDAGERGQANVPLDLLDPATGRVLATTVTDGNGNYGFDGLRLGQYAVRISPQAMDAVYRDYAMTTDPIPVAALTPGAPRSDTLDIGMKPNTPTAVVMAYLLTERQTGGTAIRWGTLEEKDTKEFRVERTTTRSRTGAVVVGSVESKGSKGGDYRIVDTNAPTSGSVYYWLIEVENSGRENLYGPAPQTTTAAKSMVYVPLVRR